MAQRGGIRIGTNLDCKLWDGEPHPLGEECGRGRPPYMFWGDGGNCWFSCRFLVLSSQWWARRNEISVTAQQGGIRIGENLGCKLWDGELHPRRAEWRARAPALHILGGRWDFLFFSFLVLGPWLVRIWIVNCGIMSGIPGRGMAGEGARPTCFLGKVGFLFGSGSCSRFCSRFSDGVI
jgi:hypothetical protein